MKRAGPCIQEAQTTSSDDSSDSSEDDDPGHEKLENKGSNLVTSKASHLSKDFVKKRSVIDYNSLSRHGYSGGPSVLKVPPTRVVEETKQDWSWSTGRREDEKAAEESYEERENTRSALAAGEMLLDARKSSLPDRKGKQMSFSQKEKRKRDMGQSTRGKNYVEEEKRLLRDSGVYSGFDS